MLKADGRFFFFFFYFDPKTIKTVPFFQPISTVLSYIVLTGYLCTE